MTYVSRMSWLYEWDNIFTLDEQHMWSLQKGFHSRPRNGPAWNFVRYLPWLKNINVNFCKLGNLAKNLKNYKIFTRYLPWVKFDIFEGSYLANSRPCFGNFSTKSIKIICFFCHIIVINKSLFVYFYKSSISFIKK